MKVTVAVVFLQALIITALPAARDTRSLWDTYIFNSDDGSSTLSPEPSRTSSVHPEAEDPSPRVAYTPPARVVWFLKEVQWYKDSIGEEAMSGLVVPLLQELLQHVQGYLGEAAVYLLPEFVHQVVFVVPHLREHVNSYASQFITYIDPLLTQSLSDFSPLLSSAVGQVHHFIDSFIEPVLSSRVLPLESYLSQDFKSAYIQVRPFFPKIWAQIRPVLFNMYTDLRPFLPSSGSLLTQTVKELLPLVPRVAAWKGLDVKEPVETYGLLRSVPGTLFEYRLQTLMEDLRLDATNVKQAMESLLDSIYNYADELQYRLSHPTSRSSTSPAAELTARTWLVIKGGLEEGECLEKILCYVTPLREYLRGFTARWVLWVVYKTGLLDGIVPSRVVSALYTVATQVEGELCCRDFICKLADFLPAPGHIHSYFG